MIRNTLLLSTFAALSMGALFACSGVDSDLLGPSGSSSGDGDSTVDAGRRTTDGGAKSDAGKTSGGGDAGSSGGGGGGSGGGGGGGGGSSVTPAVCGSALSCSSSSPVCCADQGTDGLTATTYQCVGGSSECKGTTETTVGCRDNGDCSGAICCGTLKDVTATGGYDVVACSSSCEMLDGTGQLTTQVIFCNSTADCGDTGLSCQESAVLGGFNVCGQD